MFQKILSRLFIALVSISLYSCSDDDNSPLNLPEAYDNSNFIQNTIDEQALNQNFVDLINEMKAHINNNSSANFTSLNDKRDLGNLKLNTITSSNFNLKVTQFLNQFTAASGNNWDPNQVGTAGGKFGNWVFQGEGAEPLQLIEKGSFGAAQYHYAIKNYLTPNATLADIDKALILYGAHPDFANSNNASKHTNPDKFLAAYAARRDNNSGNGIYLTIKQNFIKAQAAIKAGNDFNNEKIEALQQVISNWEKVFGATTIFYAAGTQAKLSATAPSDEDLASALHENSEGASFIMGLKGVTPKKITDTEIEEILNLFLIPCNETINAKNHALNRVAAVNAMQQIIDEVQSIYGFSNDEVAMFKKDLVTEQQR